jgi:putative oxidoreductase
MSTLESWSPKVLSLLRAVSGLLFLQHGMQKVLNFPPKPPPPVAPAMAAAATKVAVAAKAVVAAAAGPSLMKILGPASGPIELVGGVLLLIGLFSRAAAFICAGEMAFAYFLAHAPHSVYPILNGGDLAVLFCFVFLYLVFAGPGPFSIDALMKKKA